MKWVKELKLGKRLKACFEGRQQPNAKVQKEIEVPGDVLTMAKQRYAQERAHEVEHYIACLVDQTKARYKITTEIGTRR